MILIQQSDTTHPIDILMVQSSDHVTPLTGATVTVTLSKNGAAFGAAAGTVAEIANGIYKLTPTSADTGTLGELAIHATAASGDPADLLRQVVAFNPYDAVALGLSRIDAAVTSRLATGAVQVDMTQAVPTSNTAGTHGDALNAARAQGFGKWVLVGTTLSLYAADGTTVVRSFTLDSGVSPTSRT